MKRPGGLIPEQLAKAISVPIIALYIATLVAGIALLTFTPLATQLATNRTTQHLEFFFIFFNIPLSLDMFTTSIIALVVCGLCLVEAFLDNAGYFASLRGKTKGTPNWLIIAPLISSSLLVLVVLIANLQELLGLPTGSLSPRPLPVLFAELTTAPVSEEIGFRITPIGCLVALRLLLSRGSGKLSRLIPLSLLVPDKAKSEAGLESVGRLGMLRGIHWSEWIMVGSSAIIFGIAHLTGSGSMWEVGKVTTAAISGFVMGIGYLTYGAYAAILLHWFFDYYLQIASIGSMITPTPSSLHLFFTGLDFVVAFSTTIAGIVGLFVLPLLNSNSMRDRSDSSL